MRDLLGDEGFAAACQANVIKYTDRAGRKGSFLEDMAKAWWWVRMFLHVRGEADDPRSGREGFVGYSRPVRRNCYSCAHGLYCSLLDSRDADLRCKVIDWYMLKEPTGINHLPHDADGCPGFAPK